MRARISKISEKKLKEIREKFDGENGQFSFFFFFKYKNLEEKTRNFENSRKIRKEFNQSIKKSEKT